jgi:hypothetical protein
MAVFFDAKGTSQSTFQIQKGGARITNNAGTLDVKNAANTGLANLNAADLISGNATTVGALVTFGDANKVSFKYKVGEGSDQVYYWPKDGSAGQLLSTDGAGNLVWASAAGVPTDLVHVASKAIVFGDFAAPVNHKLIPIGAIVIKTEIIIDTPWDITDALIKVGKAAATDKYMTNTDSSLDGIAGDTYSAQKGQAAVLAAEQIIVTVTDGAVPATAGACRVLVHYVVPEII